MEVKININFFSFQFQKHTIMTYKICFKVRRSLKYLHFYVYTVSNWYQNKLRQRSDLLNKPGMKLGCWELRIHSSSILKYSIWKAMFFLVKNRGEGWTALYAESLASTITQKNPHQKPNNNIMLCVHVKWENVHKLLLLIIRTLHGRNGTALFPTWQFFSQKIKLIANHSRLTIS